MKQICHLNDIEDGQARAFPHPQRESNSIFIVRCADQAWGYLNMCPHMGVEMEFQKDKFMSFDNTHIQCSMHGALFDITTGVCNWGPCCGQSLVKINIKITNNHVYFIEDEEANAI